MALTSRIADPAKDRFITTATGAPATSFLCASCEQAPSEVPSTHQVVTDGFNTWQRCAGCGEQIFTTSAT